MANSDTLHSVDKLIEYLCKVEVFLITSEMFIRISHRFTETQEPVVRRVKYTNTKDP